MKIDGISLWHLTLIWAAALLLQSCASVPRTTTSEPPISTESNLAQTVADRLTGAIPGARARVKDTLTIALDLPAGGGRSIVNVDRIDAQCRADPSDCDRVMDSFVSAIAAVERERGKAADQSMLRAVVRDARYVEQLQRQSGENPQAALVTERVADGLYLVCVVDSPRAMRILNAKDLGLLKLSPEEAIARAKANTAKEFAPLQRVVREVPENAFRYLTGSPYESSRILFHQQWAAVADRAKGALIVAVPASDLVLYGNAASPDAIPALATLARVAASKAQRPITDRVYRWTPSGWIPASE